MFVQGSTAADVCPHQSLDRLAALERIIPSELIDQVLTDTDKHSRYQVKLTNQVMIKVVLGIGLYTDRPIRQVFRCCQRSSGAKTPTRSSLCRARQRLGSEPIRELHRRVVRPLATEATPGAFYRGMRLVAIDGTVLDVPDCDALQDFGRSSGSRGEGPFPQIRKVSLIECGTHIELDLVYGGWGDSERKLVDQLWDSIPADSLLLEDCGFYSYKHWKKLHQKHSLLVRIQKSMVFRPIQPFSDGSFLAKVYPSNWYREHDRQGILVRVIEYKLDDPQRTGHDEVHRLITNLTDAEKFPAMELICLYHERWESELVFDEQKTHQDPRLAENSTHLRSETKDGIRQELYAVSLAHFVIRSMMLDAAESVGQDPDCLSFKGCFQIIQLRLSECVDESPTQLATWYRQLLNELKEEQIPAHRNRVNPRVIKRKMSRWNKKRSHHRKIPPLTKTFEQSVVMKF